MRATRLAACAAALLFALLHAPALPAQLRAESVVPRPAPMFPGETAAPRRLVLAPSKASTKSTLGNAALIGGGAATMYLAYKVGEEDGGGFGTYIGVMGAVAFWAGVYRLATR